MRIEIKQNTKPGKDKMGLGLVLGFLGLMGLAYMLGSPQLAGHFPLVMERALKNVRKEIDSIVDGVGQAGSSAYRTVASIAGR